MDCEPEHRDQLSRSLVCEQNHRDQLLPLLDCQTKDHILPSLDCFMESEHSGCLSQPTDSWESGSSKPGGMWSAGEPYSQQAIEDHFTRCHGPPKPPVYLPDEESSDISSEISMPNDTMRACREPYAQAINRYGDFMDCLGPPKPICVHTPLAGVVLACNEPCVQTSRSNGDFTDCLYSPSNASRDEDSLNLSSESELSVPNAASDCTPSSTSENDYSPGYSPGITEDLSGNEEPVESSLYLQTYEDETR